MTGPGTPCLWCGESIPYEREGKRVRSDATTCGRKCRQARHRVRLRMGAAGTTDPRSTDDGSALEQRRVARHRRLPTGPIHVGYADPPYPGRARMYATEDPHAHLDAEEVDHELLIGALELSYPDGWALSTAMDCLRWILPLCPPDAHVCPWVKPIGVPAATFGLHTTWEALIVVRGRQAQPGVRDFLIAQPARRGGTLIGRKPIAFATFLFQALGLRPGDTLDDLYPGTGMIARSWAEASRATAPNDG